MLKGMTTMEETQQKGTAWVRLHLAKQTDSADMPDQIVGVLSKETASHWVLMGVIEQVETDDGWEPQQTANMHFINKTYVWNTEMLAEPPALFGEDRPYNGDGGLG
jgi:hypothetical protein